jgi:hypothetical protein
MAEVFTEFSSVLVDNNGVRYHAHACGSEMPDGKWQGWLEFVPLGGAAPIRSNRETTQPNRQGTIYWSTGLSPIYLEGALERALNPLVYRRPTPARHASSGSATHEAAMLSAQHEAVLNPFSVYQKGEWLLRNQLAALQAWHLVNIIEAYGLSEEPASTLNRLTAPRLVELIVAGVVARAER